MDLLSEVLDAPYNQVEPQEDKKSSEKPHKETQPQSKPAQEWWVCVFCISELCEGGCRGGACRALWWGVCLRSRAAFWELRSLSPTPCEGESMGSWAFLMYLLTCPDPAFRGAEAGGRSPVCLGILSTDSSPVGSTGGGEMGVWAHPLMLCYSKGGKG